MSSKKSAKKPAPKKAVKKQPKPSANKATKPAAPAKPAVAAKPPVAKKPAVVIPLAGGKTVAAPKVKIAQNGYTRPASTWSDGRPKITARVWQLADEISARRAKEAAAKKEKAKPATRQEVLAACLAEKISYSVFSNQFYRWRKFNGLFGRVKKDGSLAKCSGGPRKFRKGGETPAPKTTKPQAPAKPAVATKPAVPAAPKAAAKPAKVTTAKPAQAPAKAVSKPAAPKPAVVAKPSVPAASKPVLPFPVPAVAAPVNTPAPVTTAQG